MDREVFEALRIWIHRSLKASSMVALYGLVVLNWSTHKLLDKWHSHSKFCAFKLLLIIEMLQDHFVKMVVDPIALEGHTCVSWVDDASTETTALSRYWCSYLLILEALPGALLMRRAFPASEVIDYRELRDGISVQLHLEQLKL